MRTAVILELKANVSTFTLLSLSLGGGDREGGREEGGGRKLEYKVLASDSYFSSFFLLLPSTRQIYQQPFE